MCHGSKDGCDSPFFWGAHQFYIPLILHKYFDIFPATKLHEKLEDVPAMFDDDSEWEPWRSTPSPFSLR